jgi:type IV pilus assembly protein PilW
MSLQQNQSGLGLVELMISITIGLVIMAGVIQLFASSRQTSTTAEAVSRIQENMRYTMQRLGDDIYRAGGMGCFSFSAVGAPAPADPDDATASPLGQRIFNRLAVDDNGAAVAGLQTQSVIVGGLGALTRANQDANPDDFESSFISGVNVDAPASDSLILKYIDSTSAAQIVSIPNNQQVEVDDPAAFAVNDKVFAGNCLGIYIFNVGVSVLNPVTNTTTITMLNPGGLTHGLQANNLLNMESFLYSGASGSYEYTVGNSAAAVAVGGVCNPVATPLNCSLFRSFNGDNRELVLGVSDFQVLYGYEGVAAMQTNLNASGRLTIDRLEVTLRFNAPDPTQTDGIISIPYTRVFAVRSQL